MEGHNQKENPGRKPDLYTRLSLKEKEEGGRKEARKESPQLGYQSDTAGKCPSVCLCLWPSSPINSPPTCRGWCSSCWCHQLESLIPTWGSLSLAITPCLSRDSTNHSSTIGVASLKDASFFSKARLTRSHLAQELHPRPRLDDLQRCVEVNTGSPPQTRNRPRPACPSSQSMRLIRRFASPPTSDSERAPSGHGLKPGSLFLRRLRGCCSHNDQGVNHGPRARRQLGMYVQGT
jgi:hypothetical protein